MGAQMVQPTEELGTTGTRGVPDRWCLTSQPIERSQTRPMPPEEVSPWEAQEGTTAVHANSQRPSPQWRSAAPAYEPPTNIAICRRTPSNAQGSSRPGPGQTAAAGHDARVRACDEELSTRVGEKGVRQQVNGCCQRELGGVLAGKAGGRALRSRATTCCRGGRGNDASGVPECPGPGDCRPEARVVGRCGRGARGPCVLPRHGAARGRDATSLAVPLSCVRPYASHGTIEAL